MIIEVPQGSCLGSLLFWGGEHLPDVIEIFQLLPRCHLSLHRNGKDSFDWCCRVNTIDVIINHTNHLRLLS